MILQDEEEHISGKEREKKKRRIKSVRVFPKLAQLELVLEFELGRLHDRRENRVQRDLKLQGLDGLHVDLDNNVAVAVVKHLVDAFGNLQ